MIKKQNINNSKIISTNTSRKNLDKSFSPVLDVVNEKQKLFHQQESFNRLHRFYHKKLQNKHNDGIPISNKYLLPAI